MKFICSIFLMFYCFAGVAQYDQEVTTSNGKPFLLGKVSLDGLQSLPYGEWYNPGFEGYEVDETMVNLFKKQLSECHIKLFLGTWCGDSKREVPRFIKILKAADYPMEQLQIVAVDRRRETYKTSPGGEEWGLNLVKVPTIIFLKDGKEINRIIERPVESLEEDLTALLLKKVYTPNYATLVRSK